MVQWVFQVFGMLHFCTKHKGSNISEQHKDDTKEIKQWPKHNPEQDDNTETETGLYFKRRYQ